MTKRLLALFWLLFGIAITPLMLSVLLMWLIGTACMWCHGERDFRDAWRNAPIHGFKTIANDFKIAFGRRI
jgi:hypothetical protein